MFLDYFGVNISSKQSSETLEITVWPTQTLLFTSNTSSSSDSCLVLALYTAKCWASNFKNTSNCWGRPWSVIESSVSSCWVEDEWWNSQKGKKTETGCKVLSEPDEISFFFLLILVNDTEFEMWSTSCLVMSSLWSSTALQIPVGGVLWLLDRLLSLLSLGRTTTTTCLYLFLFLTLDTEDLLLSLCCFTLVTKIFCQAAAIRWTFWISVLVFCQHLSLSAGPLWAFSNNCILHSFGQGQSRTSPLRQQRDP